MVRLTRIPGPASEIMFHEKPTCLRMRLVIFVTECQLKCQPLVSGICSSFLQSPEMKNKWKSGNACKMQRKYLASVHPSRQPVSTILSPKCCLTFLSILGVLQTTWDLNYSTTTKKQIHLKNKITFPSSQKNKPTQPTRPFPPEKVPRSITSQISRLVSW